MLHGRPRATTTTTTGDPRIVRYVHRVFYTQANMPQKPKYGIDDELGTRRYDEIQETWIFIQKKKEFF